MSLISIALGAEARPKKKITVTLELLRQDRKAIEIYVVQDLFNDIEKAKSWGKGVATHWMNPLGVSEYTYDSIPFGFFSNKEAIEKTFERTENHAAAEYIQKAKEEYKKAHSSYDDDKVAKFLYGRAVKHLPVSEDEKKELLKCPQKMSEYAHEHHVHNIHFMDYTLVNFKVRFYLEKEFGRLN